jgi:glycopeptide antibiotics resistance protein
MTNLIFAIVIGIKNFPFFAVLATVPIIAIQVIRYRKMNIVRIGLDYALILYYLCLLSLVFFPLPTPAQAASLSTHNIQLLPFHFVADIVRESPFVLSNPHTYIPALFDNTILQVVFNVVLTVPFGMFLRYYCGCDSRRIILYSFLLSLFIEIGQLTGLFFIYHGSYRLCDVDDLMTNTLGGFLGYALIHQVERYIPSIHAFDRALPFSKKLLQA